MKIGSVIYIEEELGSKYMKIKSKIKEIISSKKLVLKAKFPASLVGLKLISHVEENDRGFLYSQSYEVDFRNPLLFFWNYSIKKLHFKENFQKMMDEHSKEDLENIN
ncbi:MAG: hypothetical protein ACFFCM_20200 [Promethearchaeota archaeon]